MVEGQEVVDFHQSDCKNPRIWPRGQSPKAVANLKCLLFDEGDGLSKEVWDRTEMETQTMVNGHRFFPFH
jgi:hypothetical protein